MCGIGLVFLDSSDNYDASDQQNALRQCLLRRGPDYQGELVVGNDQHPLWMVGSVLHIQGESLCRQPVQDSSGNVLLWNGEVFGGDVEVPKGCSDTTIVSQLLQQSCEGKDADSMGSCVIDALSRIEGPFAFIFYHALTDTIYFGRDSIGRRSLVLTIEKGNNGSDDDDVSNTSRIRSISSVSYGLATTSPSDNGAESLLEEVQIGGIYRVSSSGDRSTVTKLSWPSTRVSLRRELQLNCNLPESERSTFEGSVGRFSDILHQAVRKRLVRIGFNTNDESENDQVMASSSDNFDSFQSSSFTMRSTRVGVLFSGGIDSLLLAAVLHLTLEDAHEPIDLFNVAFVEENGTTSSPAPDRLGGIVGLLELKKLFPTREFRLVHVDVKPSERMHYEAQIKRTIEPLDTHMDLNIGTAFWFASRGQGYLRDYTLEEMEQAYEASSAEERGPLLRLGEEDAMKSVGLLATDEESREKFYQKQKKSEEGSGEPLPCNNPLCNRVGKPGCCRNMCKRCCDRTNREEQLLIDPDVTKTFLNNCPVHKASEKKISNLKDKANKRDALKKNKKQQEKDSIEENLAKEDVIEDTSCQVEEVAAEIVVEKQSSATPTQVATEEQSFTEKVTNESITATQPQIEELENRLPYTSRCKVLLVGLGADEQMAGYGRHRTCFAQSGWEGLCAELNMDLERLWTRNLGRDDRCISDNGKEGWFPYLDESLVHFIQSTPIDIIADLSLAPGVGDKRILRTTASRLGLSRSCQLVKRAIQFGTLAAKQTSVQYYGSRRKGKGTSKI